MKIEPITNGIFEEGTISAEQRLPNGDVVMGTGMSHTEALIDCFKKLEGKLSEE
jgi:hypothetical protein